MDSGTPMARITQGEYRRGRAGRAFSSWWLFFRSPTTMIHVLFAGMMIETTGLYENEIPGTFSILFHNQRDVRFTLCVVAIMPSIPANKDTAPVSDLLNLALIKCDQIRGR